jgi:hypothetical protein
MPKIPTFTAQGSITQLAGTTNAPQIGLDQTIGNALSPVTDMVIKKAVQENDTQNRTEALRLGNEFTRKLNTLEDTIANDNTGLGVNKQSANSYYKQQTNNLINQFKSQASNNATATLFTNNALNAVNRGIFRIDTIVDKNVFKDLTTQVELAEKSLITQALFNNRDENVVDEFGMLGNVNDFDYASLQTNLTKLYTDAFSGKIPAANLNAMVNNIPALVQGFQANKDIYDNPSFAYTELNKGENSSVYPDLKVEQRTKLINKVETMMAQPLQVEFANVIFSLQDKGTEQPFDFNFAKKILPPEKYNELKTTYDLAKINAEDVRLVRTLPLDEADKLIESKNFGTDLYVGSADRITQAKLKEGLIKVRNNAEKQMLEDPVKFQIETSPEIEELTNNYRTETNPEIKLANRKILTNAIIEDQIKRGADLAKLKILTKQEVTQIKDEFLNASVTSEDKLKLIEQLKLTYGDENMGKILNHLQDEKTPDTILMAIATDSIELAKDLFDSSTLEDLKKIAVQKDIQPNNVLKKIMKKTEDFGEVLNSQGEGSESKDAKMLRINEALLKASLLRIDKNTSVDDAIESAANDFLKDYVLNNSLTALIPKTINRITIPTAAVQNKAEAILIGIKDDSPGNYLERFMGEKGFMHYAESLNLSNVTEEDVKKRIGFTIRNYSKWLNNSDMTGMVLYADFGAAGMQPVVNADNQRVEFYFTDLPNQDPTIKDTISVYPVTGDELPLIPDPPSDDYFQYNENLIDDIIVDGKKNSKIPVDDQSSIFKTIGDAIISPVAASDMNLTSSKKIILDKVGGDIYNEESQNNLQKFITAVHDVESNSGDKDFLLNESSATGDFQFKTKDNLDKNGKVKLDENGTPLKSSFETALSRLETQYKKANTTIPNWVKKAKETKNPTKFILEELTYDQQEELFLMNIYGQVESDALIKAMLDGDMDKAIKLYAQFHHTKMNVVNDKVVKRKFKKAYND